MGFGGTEEERAAYLPIAASASLSSQTDEFDEDHAAAFEHYVELATFVLCRFAASMGKMANVLERTLAE